MKRGLRFLAMFLAVAGASPALAQNLPAKDIADQAQTLKSEQYPEAVRASAGEPADATATPTATTAETAGSSAPVVSAPSGKPDLVIAPIPIANPSIGTGLAAAAVLFYNPNHASQPWVTGVGGGYTSSRTWAAGAFHSMSLGHDSVRALVFAGYGDARLDFYGIGPAAGEAGISVEMRDRAIVGLVDVEGRPINRGLLRNFYLGGRVFVLDLDASVTLPIPNRLDLEPPVLERDSLIAMIGPAFTYDSRDSSTNPRKGVYATGTLLFGADWLGSDFTHHKLQLGANSYFPVGKGTVFAIRQQLCDVSNGAPYYDLCLFGQQGDLRGYEAGRYRDGASWALQAEVRQHLFWKIGAVAFAGVGGIADNFSAIWDDSTVLASGGVGLRFLASESSNVNLRVDVAWGKDGSAFYFGIGEAF